MDREEQDLDKALDAWNDVDVAHYRLPSRVWSRIVNEEKSPAVLPGFLGLVQTLLSRPVYASAFLVLCVLGGLLLAEIRVAREQVQRGEQLAEAYKQVIDPLLNESDFER